MRLALKLLAPILSSAQHTGVVVISYISGWAVAHMSLLWSQMTILLGSSSSQLNGRTALGQCMQRDSLQDWSSVRDILYGRTAQRERLVCERNLSSVTCLVWLSRSWYSARWQQASMLNFWVGWVCLLCLVAHKSPGLRVLKAVRKNF